MKQDDPLDVDDFRKPHHFQDQSRSNDDGDDDDDADSVAGLSNELLEQLSLAQGKQVVDSQSLDGEPTEAVFVDDEQVDDFQVLDDSNDHEEEDELSETFSAAESLNDEEVDHASTWHEATAQAPFNDWDDRKSDPVGSGDGQLNSETRLHSQTRFTNSNIEVSSRDQPTGLSDSALRATIEASEQRIVAAFEGLNRADQTKNELIQSLHEELSQYRRGIADTILLSLVRPLVRYVDQTAKQVEALQSKPPEEVDAQRLFSALASVQGDLTNILEDVGVKIYEHPTGRFDPEVQQSRSTVPTNDKEKHRLIDKRLLPGYTLNGQVIEKERVRVCVYSDKPN